MRRLAVTLLIALSLAACQSARPPRADAFYRIVVAPPGTTAPVAGEFNVRMNPVRAQGVYADATLLGRAPGDTAPLYRHFYDRWAQPPATMLTAVFAHRLVEAMGAARVRVGDETGEARWTVTADLRGLERVLGDHRSEAHLAMDFVVQDDAGHVLDSFSFERSEPATDEALESYVAAVDRLVGTAADLMVSRVRGLAASNGDRPAPPQ